MTNKKDISVFDAASLNMAAYECHDIGKACQLIPNGWNIVSSLNCKKSCTGLLHVRNEHWDFISVRGTHALVDVKDVFGVFLGKVPSKRVKVVQDYIDQLNLSDRNLMLGGHSLGGIIASAVAVEKDIPALVLNSPGWFGAISRPAKILEIRSAKDIVGLWGGHPGRTMVIDGSNHKIETQLSIIEKKFSGVGVLEVYESLEQEDVSVLNFKHSISVFREKFKSDKNSRLNIKY